MTKTDHAADFKMIPCPSCAWEISIDADACPSCGAPNSWVHPTLRTIIDHIGTLDRVTKYECRGRRMHLVSTSQNTRQIIGSFMMVAAMVLLVLGIFIPFLLGLAILCICVGGLLTLFGLSVFTRHELTIDLRLSDPIVGTHDQRFWADIVRIVKLHQGPNG